MPCDTIRPMKAMTWIPGVWTLIALVVCGVPAWAQDGELVEVFIDAREPAYVVFQGVSDDVHPLARQEMQGYATLDKVSLVPWEQFRTQAEEFVATGVVKNEYPGAGLTLGILALLKLRPGRPIAVTWNGGIAASFFDFQYAVEAFEQYQDDPLRYERERTDGVSRDPLHPQHHFKALQGG